MMTQGKAKIDYDMTPVDVLNIFNNYVLFGMTFWDLCDACSLIYLIYITWSFIIQIYSLNWCLLST